MTIKALSPQNQIDSNIHLSEVKSFFFTKNIGIMEVIVNIINMLLILSLCSCGVIDATLIRKISNPPMNTIT
jgi:hypothetical protein